MVTRLIAGVSIAAILLLVPAPPRKLQQSVVTDSEAYLTALEHKMAAIASSNNAVMLRYNRLVQPIEMELVRRAIDPMQARIAAWAIVREAEKTVLSPRLIAEVMKAEDPWLVTDTVSFAGAVGWMQIMPMHVYDAHPCGTDLTDGPINVCYGADILRRYLGEALVEALRVALLRYNGCVSTPGCEQYAERIIANLTTNDEDR